MRQARVRQFDAFTGGKATSQQHNNAKNPETVSSLNVHTHSPQCGNNKKAKLTFGP
jgi:hypothetical protein